MSWSGHVQQHIIMVPFLPELMLMLLERFSFTQHQSLYSMSTVGGSNIQAERFHSESERIENRKLHPITFACILKLFWHDIIAVRNAINLSCLESQKIAAGLTFLQESIFWFSISDHYVLTSQKSNHVMAEFS